MKTVKLTLPSDIHNFEIVKVIKGGSFQTCSKCGLEVFHPETASYVDVKLSRKNKYLIENCMPDKEKAQDPDSQEQTSAEISILPVESESGSEDKEKMSLVPQPKTMNLKCEFDEKQIREMSSELADSYLDMFKIEEEKKSANDEFKSRLAKIEIRVSELSHKIHDGCTYENIEIEEKMNTPRNHEKTIIRLDTNVEIGVVPMEDEDYSLFPDETPVDTPKKKKHSKKTKKV